MLAPMVLVSLDSNNTSRTLCSKMNDLPYSLIPHVAAFLKLLSAFCISQFSWYTKAMFCKVETTCFWRWLFSRGRKLSFASLTLWNLLGDECWGKISESKSSRVNDFLCFRARAKVVVPVAVVDTVATIVTELSLVTSSAFSFTAIIAVTTCWSVFGLQFYLTSHTYDI